ncbi:MAG: ABC-F type ribosomal protection protein [Ruminococcaceae bacterium]|nr:ABC-F type ribosomal protection protein [Oscillospiraceae bacterium]
MIILSCENVKIAFGTDVIIDGVSFSVNEGDRLGIVGVNGAGKSTLLRAVNGELEPESGNIYLSKNKTVGMLSQTDFFHEENTVYEEMLLTFSELMEREQRLTAMRLSLEKGEQTFSIASYTAEEERFSQDGGYEYKGRVKGLLKNMGFDESDSGRLIKTLSGGQKTRLSLVRLLLREPDVLMLDEPTNHLDVETLEWLEDYLSRYKKTLLVVSHDRFFLDRVCDKILDIENGGAKLYSGNYTVFAEKKKKDREIAERHYKNQQREIARIEAYIEQQRRWNRERNIIAAESRQKALDRMVKVEKPQNLPDSVRMKFENSLKSGEEVFKVKNLSKRFGERVLFSDVNFLIHAGQRVFITGRNGCGKSTLMKILAGKMADYEGKAEAGYNVRFSYYDQENQQLNGQNTVLDELWDCYPHLTQTEIRNTLALFLFKGDDIGKTVSVLSGGEKARLTMAKLMLSKVNLLLLDEPTNHLDIRSREVLEDAILSFEGTVIAVSHDRYFMKKLATRFLDFTDGGLTDYEGSYDEFQQYKQNRQASAAERDEQGPVRSESDAKAEFLKNKKENAEKRRQEKALQNALKEIERLEKRLDEIKAEEEASASDHVKLAALWEEKEKSEERLLELYELTEG